MPMQVTASGVSELIRRAEKHIKAGNLSRASDLLSNARSLEPANEYIGAIMERIALRERAPGTMTATPNTQAAALLQAAQNDLQQQVKRLTADARSLFERGAYVTAFDTLMKAYLLDPLSADVMKTEELIVPAFEQVRKRGTLLSPAPVQPGTAQILRQHLAATQQDAATPAPPSAPEPEEASARPHGGFFSRFRKSILPG